MHLIIWAYTNLLACSEINDRDDTKEEKGEVIKITATTFEVSV